MVLASYAPVQKKCRRNGEPTEYPRFRASAKAVPPRQLDAGQSRYIEAVRDGSKRTQANTRPEARGVGRERGQAGLPGKMARLDRGEIRVEAEKLSDPILVLALQQRAGHVNQPAAILHV